MNDLGIIPFYIYLLHHSILNQKVSKNTKLDDYYSYVFNWTYI